MKNYLDYNEDAEHDKAQQARHKEFVTGLRKSMSFGQDDPKAIIQRAMKFLQDCTTELDEGKVSTLEFATWDIIKYILSFDMEYTYAGFDKEEYLGGAKPELCIFGASDILSESADQERLRKLLKAYLTAGAALSRKASSSAYEEWIKLLMELEFTGRHGICQFSRKTDANKFFNRMRSALKRTWADNEVYQHILIASNPPPPHGKRAKKTRCEGGVLAIKR